MLCAIANKELADSCFGINEPQAGSKSFNQVRVEGYEEQMLNMIDNLDLISSILPQEHRMLLLHILAKTEEKMSCNQPTLAEYE